MIRKVCKLGVPMSCLDVFGYKVLSSRRGASVLAMALGASVVVGVSMATFMMYVDNTLGGKTNEIRALDLNFANQRALTLGGYLVSTNLILCRSEGWQDLPSGQKCRWGGAYHVSKQTPDGIPISKYDIEKVDTSEGSLRLILNHDIDGRKLQSYLYFNLQGFQKDDNLRKYVGLIPAANAVVDNDEDMVVMKAESVYTVGEQKQRVHILGAMRRPMGSPEFRVESNPACDYSCVSGISENPNPECRGPDEVPQAGFSQVFMTVRNLGPGPIYKMKLEKTTTYDPDFYPGVKDKVDQFDVMATADVLMPGETTKVPDKMECVRPITVSRTVTASAVTSGSYNGSYTATSVRSNVHYERTSSFNYDLNPGKVRSEYLTTEQSKKYDPGVPATYAGYENLSSSVLEPSRMAKKAVSIGGANTVTVTENVTTVTTVTVRRSRPH